MVTNGDLEMSQKLFPTSFQITGHLDIKFLVATNSISLLTLDIIGLKKILTLRRVNFVSKVINVLQVKCVL